VWVVWEEEEEECGISERQRASAKALILICCVVFDCFLSVTLLVELRSALSLVLQRRGLPVTLRQAHTTPHHTTPRKVSYVVFSLRGHDIVQTCADRALSVVWALTVAIVGVTVGYCVSGVGIAVGTLVGMGVGVLVGSEEVEVKVEVKQYRLWGAAEWVIVEDMCEAKRKVNRVQEWRHYKAEERIQNSWGKKALQLTQVE
jgi:hypothetical protein